MFFQRSVRQGRLPAAHPKRRRSWLRLESLELRQLMAGDVILDWNDVIADTIRADTTKPGPTWSSRNYAIVHAAMYDAVNGIVGGYSPYLFTTPGPRAASAEAAAAAAAHLTLESLYPEQVDRFNSALAQSLSEIPDGFAESAGVAYGEAVALAILAARADDHAADLTEYSPIDEPGHWQPEPGSSQAALGPGWGKVNLFGVSSTDDFGIPPPPALDSAEYAEAFNEVKELGAADSAVRTEDQTEIGIFWGYDRGGLGPPLILYNQIAQTISHQTGNTLAENARLFALLNIAQADAGIVCWDMKYDYDFWRPVTGIREADSDGNPLTEADPNWIPLGAPAPTPFTPPFPAYSSGHATFGGSMFKTLERFYGSDHVTFTIGSDELPGVSRTYQRFSQAAEENARSRIYLGIHWNFDATAGIECGNDIADYIFENLLSPIEQPSTVGLFAGNRSAFLLKDSNSAGPADQMFGYGPAASGWQEIVGDWNGDGADTAGLYDAENGTFYLKNDNSAGRADVVFSFGPAGVSWRAIAGDWDGDGLDTVGLYAAEHGAFFLQNSLEPGVADIAFNYGPVLGQSPEVSLDLSSALPVWQPLVGDWDGDGIETVGLYAPIGHPASGNFFLRNEHAAGPADNVVGYGPTDRNLMAISGDWDGNGIDTIGLFDQLSNEFFLRDSNTPGIADLRFQYGPIGSGWTPIAGVWTLPNEQGAQPGDNHSRPALADRLDVLRDAAIARWIAAGATARQIELLQTTELEISDLPGGLLSQFTKGVVYVDVNAAGQGWSIDSTPTDDTEYEAIGDRLTAIDEAMVSDGIDLVTVLAYELGQALGSAET